MEGDDLTMSVRPLVLATSFSPLFSRVCLDLQKKYMGTAIFATTQKDSFQNMKAIGISPILIEIPSKTDWVKKDKTFRADYMPGESLDFNIPSTDLPIWKSLSLDRLYFWYAEDWPQKILSLIECFDYSELFLSFQFFELF